MISVLVVDDSRFMRTVIQKKLEDAGFTVYTAQDGVEAVESVAEYKPDVITMDVQMPNMNGIEALEEIMQTNPTPTVMLSAHTKDDAEITLEALDKGAVDFMMKPGGEEVSIESQKLTAELIEVIEAVADVSVSEPSVSDSAGPITTESDPDVVIPSQIVTEAADVDRCPTIVFGASTGGPKILEQLMEALPTKLRARIIIVQHMPANFTRQFARRLDSISEYSVREGSDVSEVGCGEAVVAPGGVDLQVTEITDDNAVRFTTGSHPDSSISPSINIAMKSIAEVVPGPLVGVALTGMGDDVSVGIQSIKNAGGYTIAQDERSSTVFGIPQRAIETGCVDTVASDSDIVAEITAFCDAITESNLKELECE